MKEIENNFNLTNQTRSTLIKRFNGGVHSSVGGLAADRSAKLVTEMRVEFLFVVG